MRCPMFFTGSGSGGRCSQRALRFLNQTNMKRKTKKLPKKFAKYFWDCDFAKVQLEQYPLFILGRLMGFGGEDAILWVLGNFSPREVKRVLSSKSGTGQLDKRSLLFWTRISKARNLWRRRQGDSSEY